MKINPFLLGAAIMAAGLGVVNTTWPINALCATLWLWCGVATLTFIKRPPQRQKEVVGSIDDYTEMFTYYIRSFNEMRSAYNESKDSKAIPHIAVLITPDRDEPKTKTDVKTSAVATPEMMEALLKTALARVPQRITHKVLVEHLQTLKENSYE